MRQHGAPLPLKADAATNTENGYPPPPVLPPRFAGGGAGSAYAAARAALDAAAAEQAAAEQAAAEQAAAVPPPDAPAVHEQRVHVAAREGDGVPLARARLVLHTGAGAGERASSAHADANGARADALLSTLSASSSSDEQSSDEEGSDDDGGSPVQCTHAPASAAPGGGDGSDFPRTLHIPQSSSDDGSSSDEDEALAALCRKYGVPTGAAAERRDGA
jgi:hypothetical protein